MVNVYTMLSHPYSKSIQETFKPRSVFSAQEAPLLFVFRCLFDLQLKTIDDFLRPRLKLVSGNILDIGTGDSPWKSYLNPKVDFTGLDTIEASAFGMRKNKDTIYYSGLTFPFPDQSFDNALCVEVLEHIPDTGIFLSEIFRVLKHKGTLIMTVPFSARRHYVPCDYYRFTREALELLLTKQGFYNISIKERGNDITTIFNKILVILLNLLTKKSLVSLMFATLLIPFFILLFLASHLSLLCKSKFLMDPLGYSIVATKP